MKLVILAGGLGTRISEETVSKPKPMVEIGGKPIIWHIMKLYSHYGINEFIICCGYKGYIIKEFFYNFFLHHSDITIDMVNNTTEMHQKHIEPWKVTLVDTGEATMTGGRLKRVYEHLKNEDMFCMTYGDGLSNVNIKELIDFHRKANVKATLTAVFPPARFGAIEIVDNRVKTFREKPTGEDAIINGGFFVLSPQVFNYITDDKTVWERGPLEKLAEEGELAAYLHRNFWQPMDTLRDKNYLNELWDKGSAPWKKW